MRKHKSMLLSDLTDAQYRVWEEIKGFLASGKDNHRGFRTIDTGLYTAGYGTGVSNRTLQGIAKAGLIKIFTGHSELSVSKNFTLTDVGKAEIANSADPEAKSIGRLADAMTNVSQVMDKLDGYMVNQHRELEAKLNDAIKTIRVRDARIQELEDSLRRAIVKLGGVRNSVVRADHYFPLGEVIDSLYGQFNDEDPEAATEE